MNVTPPPLQQISQLNRDVAILKQHVATLGRETAIDDQLEYVYLEDLAAQFDASMDNIKKKLTASGGKPFKLGKKYVIRKVQLLSVMEHLENY